MGLEDFAESHAKGRGNNQHDKQWTREEVLSKLEEVKDKVGETFTARDVEDIHRPAVLYQCKKMFGSFNDAKLKVTDSVYTPDNKESKADPDLNSEWFGYVLGVVHSDGWLSDDTRIGLDVTSEDFILQFAIGLCAVRGLDFDELDNWVSVSTSDRDGTKIYKLRKRWKALYDVLDEEFTLDSWTEWMTWLDRGQLAQYTRGVYESEGSVMESGYRVTVTDANHASAFLYALSSCLDEPSTEFSYRVNNNSVENSYADLDERVMISVYIPAEHRSKFKGQINPTIKRGPDHW